MHFLLILSTLDDQNIHENAKICRNVMLLFGFTMRSAFKKVQNPSVGWVINEIDSAFLLLKNQSLSAHTLPILRIIPN